MSKKPSVENLQPRNSLRSFARRQNRDTDQLTVKPEELKEYQSRGWRIARENKASFRLSRPKQKGDLLEARVWRVLYKMGFPVLSGEAGAKLVLNAADPKSPRHQIDVVAVDDEVALAVECKSYESYRKDTRFSDKLAKHAGIRRHFADAVHNALPLSERRQVSTMMVVWDLDLRDTDRKRAEEADVLLLDEHELEYYEGLVKHVGPAARFQLLADAFRGRRIKGLSIKVPALRTKMGRMVCYTFSVRPDYLLKIAYIAHRAKGKAIDIDAYQRMLSRSRLKKIGEFITDGGIFPTNIVVNLEDTRHLRFDKGKQADDDGAGGLFGWLTLNPSYGSAWIIDGQHRLFAYSGHERAESSYLNVLAFEGLGPARQTELFVNINSEQRRVPRTLLVELDATLKWDDEDEEKRIHAIVSKVSMGLDEKDSPLADRVLLADVRRTKTRCVSLTAIATALTKPGFFVVKRHKGYTQYGPLWRDDPTDALHRALATLKAWLGTIASEAADWWELGQDEGGGLAMNDGVTVCINMLRSVLEHLNHNDALGPLDNEELLARIQPYALAVGRYFARMEPEERRRFRALRGGQGQDTGTRECQAGLQAEFAKYKPDGLAEWIKRRKANTNEQARRIIDQMEKDIQATVLEVLREEFDLDADAWWFEGVPVNVRKKVSERIEEAGGGLREESFDLVHYETIIRANWQLFKPTFAFGEAKNIGKDKGTQWLRQMAKWRNKVMHPSRRDYLGLEELQQLEDYQAWLKAQLLARAGG